MSRPKRNVVAPTRFGNLASSLEIPALTPADEMGTPAPPSLPATSPRHDHAPHDALEEGELPPASNDEGGLNSDEEASLDEEDIPPADYRYDDAVELEEEDSDGFTGKRDRSKRPSRSRAAIAARAGKPDPYRKNAKNPPLLKTMFQRFPLEILHEIFGQLDDVKTLLQVARTSRGLRSHLFDIKAKPIWERNWKSEGLADLCEHSSYERAWTIPEMVSFVFDTYCTFEGCRTGRKGTLDFGTRTRFCKSCAKLGFQMQGYSEPIPAVYRIIPTTHTPLAHTNRYNRAWAVTSVYDLVVNHIDATFPYDEDDSEDDSAEVLARSEKLIAWLVVPTARQQARAEEAIMLRDWYEEKAQRRLEESRVIMDDRIEEIGRRCMSELPDIPLPELQEAFNAIPRRVWARPTALTERVHPPVFLLAPRLHRSQVWAQILQAILDKVDQLHTEREELAVMLAEAELEMRRVRQTAYLDEDERQFWQ